MSRAEELAEILQGVTSAACPEVRTLDDAMRVYLVDYVRRGASMKTVFNAYLDISRFVKDVAVYDNQGEPFPLEMLRRQTIEAHLARLAAGQEIGCTRVPSPYTVERRRRVVKAFIRWLVREEYLANDPTRRLVTVQLRERFPSVWTLEEVSRFLETFDKTTIIGHRNYAIALLALSSGLRAGEIALLRPMDINFASRTIAVSEQGKTGARTAVMNQEAATELSKWVRRRNRELKLPDHAPLFPSIGQDGQKLNTEPMRARTISRIIADHAKRAGIEGVKRGAHALRHTAASYLARNGASAFEIQRFLGHSSIDMSMRYVAMNNEAVQRCVEERGILAQLSGQHASNGEMTKEDILKRILANK